VTTFSPLFIEVCNSTYVTNGHAVNAEAEYFKAGHEVSFSCNEGFSSPHSTTTCQATKTWSPQPVCTEVTCKVPRLINGGYTTNPGNREANEREPLKYNALISPNCNEGYMLSMDLSQRVCKSDGQWSGTEVNCNPITCDRLPDTFANGYYDSRDTQAPFPYNYKITAVCHNGYHIAQGAIRSCFEPNIWSGTNPTCGRITCLSPTTFSDGHYNESRRPYDFGTVLVPTCNTGYYLSNNVEQRVCEQHNSWSGTDPECRRITCQLPTPFSDGHYKGKRHPYYYGTTLEPACNIGFYLSNNVETRVCEQLDTWSGTNPECKRITCRSPTPFYNGKYNGSQETYDFGTVLIPSCDTGYYMSNNLKKLVCEQLDTWSNSRFGVYPTCQRIWCMSLTTFKNGQYNGSQWRYDFGTTLVPTCNPGYYLSNNLSKRVCEQLHKWSGKEPVCEIIKCKIPTVLNGRITSSRTHYTYSEKIFMQCDQGYEIRSGSAIRTCQANGTWNQPPVECVKFLCNDTSGIIHAAITPNAYPTLAFGQSGNVTFNSTLFYLRQGSVEVTCSKTRQLTWVTKPYFGMIYN